MTTFSDSRKCGRHRPPAVRGTSARRDGLGRKKGLALGAVVLANLISTPLFSQEISVPSGVSVTLFDVRLEDDPAIARFRFVSTAVDPDGEGRRFEDLVDDLQFLCENVVLPSLAANDWPGTSVVLSVASQETEFGIFDPGVTQFFQPYKIAGETCVWEDF